MPGFVQKTFIAVDFSLILPKDYALKLWLMEEIEKHINKTSLRQDLSYTGEISLIIYVKDRLDEHRKIKNSD